MRSVIAARLFDAGKMCDKFGGIGSQTFDTRNVSNAVNAVTIITTITMIVVVISSRNFSRVFSLVFLSLVSLLSLLEVLFTESFGAVDGWHSEPLNVEIFKVFPVTPLTYGFMGYSY